ncbi:prepilin-type N-terminal cleavage/methylation domain-containing protein [Vibrio sp. M260118]|uniref:prepilin-type N-terminal cleavage/methylation domain-containing protein n=1 Tax=Vibrio sp. M260118 TaxID=3020896 RepID=UPI002F41445A
MRSNWRGFSLLEVLIALLLVAIASLSLIAVQVRMEQRADYASSSSKALSLIEQKLEWFRSRGANSMQSEILPANFDSMASGSDIHGAFTIAWQISSPSSSLETSLKQIALTAEWKDRFGKTYSLSVKTMLSRHSEF